MKASTSKIEKLKTKRDPFEFKGNSVQLKLDVSTASSRKEFGACKYSIFCAEATKQLNGHRSYKKIISIFKNLSSNNFRQTTNNWSESEFASSHLLLSPLSVDSPPPESGTGISMLHYIFCNVELTLTK
ncbi:hypothetical protein YC2023_074686 [Brassica napus]